MRSSTEFDVAVPRDRVVAYLSNPRNLVMANHEGPVVEQSNGALADGSWFVLKLDQIRLRIEYLSYAPPERLVVQVSATGLGSGGMDSSQEFTLSELPGGLGTRVESVVEGAEGWLRWGPLLRWSQSRYWRRLRERMEAAASGSQAR